MRDHIAEFADAYEYLPQDKTALLEAYDKIAAADKTCEAFDALLRTYEQDPLCDKAAARASMREIAACAGVHPYTGDLLLYIGYAKALPGHYRAAALPASLCRDCLFDLKYKLAECRAVYGMCGSFVADWFDRFFELTRFSF